MSESRLEKFLYALYSLDSSDLPTPLSRIEELYKCLVTGEEAPTFEPLSRVEKYLMAILGAYDADSLPNPLSRVEVLLYKLATGDDNLDDVKSFLSEHEELLSEIIRNGGVGGNIDIEYVLYTLSTEHNTLYNTAEKPVKSAILKGRTLVNLHKLENHLDIGVVLDGGINQHFGKDTSYATWRMYDISMLKPNTEYGVFCWVLENTISENYWDGHNYHSADTVFNPSTELRFSAGETGLKFAKLTTISDFTGKTCGIRHLINKNTPSSEYVKFRCVIVEYQEGMENWDIPYFEGMQSVKMPVLTTTGKNLFDKEKFIDKNQWSADSNESYRSISLQLEPNTVYTMTRGSISCTGHGLYVNVSNHRNSSSGSHWWLFHHSANYNNKISFTTNETGIIYFNSNTVALLKDYKDLLNEVQLEKGDTVTSYEPFKSNILTVNEEVELRGIGDVKDELDLVEGIHTKRIGVMIMDDTTSIELYEVTTDAGTVSFYYFTGDGKSNKPNGYTYHYCDSLPVFQQGEALADRSKEWTFYNEFGGSTIFFNIKQDKVGGATLKHIKDYLKYNPIKITYVLENEEVKTVDLSVVDQDGNNAELSTFNDLTHVTLSSEELIPEAELEVATKNEEDLDDSSVYTTHTLSEEFNTLYNTAEKPVKSAILKGRTLVNLVNDVTSNEVGNYSNSPCKINVIRNLQNETLTIIFNVISLEIPDGADGTLRIGGGWSGQIRCQPTLGVNKVLYNCNQTSNSWLGVFSNSGAYNLGQRITISDVMVLEGDYTNIDIPYFEGMKSVQMPVLKTTGKNLFDGKLEYGIISGSNGNLYNSNDYVRTQDFIPINCEEITYTVINEQCGLSFYFYDKDKNFISNMSIMNVNGNLSIPEGVAYLKFRTYPLSNESVTTNLNTQIQIEEGSVATEYESFKSNILTVNEDVELRGVGDVKDELNLLTGELTQRIEEIVLDGSENWTQAGSQSSGFARFYTSAKIKKDPIAKVISPNFPSYNGSAINYGVNGTENITGISANNFFNINIRTDRIGITDLKNKNENVELLKQWLSNNPITIQYELATESIKTVDLSVVDQDGNSTKLSTFNDITHVTLSSEGLIPEAELEVAEKVTEVAASMLTISREQEVIDTTTNEQSENVDATMIATTEIYEELL